MTDPADIAKQVMDGTSMRRDSDRYAIGYQCAHAAAKRAIQSSTREEVREFNLAFGRPINDRVVPLTVTERELLGKILFEEVVEYVTLGLGLYIDCKNMVARSPDNFDLRLDEGRKYDPIESADGLGDVNVVIHFAAHWHGFDLDKVTSEIHRSNMSKLGEDGKAIINGETPGYQNAANILRDFTAMHGLGNYGTVDDSGFDSSKPVGKILKGPNYFKPDIASQLTYSEEMRPGHLHISSTEIRDEAKEDKCPDHPNATATPGYGLAGGGMGSYMVCDECGRVFGKTADMGDE